MFTKIQQNVLSKVMSAITVFAVVASIAVPFSAIAAPGYTMGTVTFSVTGALELSISGSASSNPYVGGMNQQNVSVDWGDGARTQYPIATDSHFVTTSTSNPKVFQTSWSGLTHTYTTAGTKTIIVKVHHQGWNGNGEGDGSEFTTNVFIPPAALKVIKVVSGGTAVPGDFTLSVTGTNVSPASFTGQGAPGTTVSLSAGSYSVSELDTLGHGVSYSADCSGTIASGQTKTCTVTNTFNPNNSPVLAPIGNQSGDELVAMAFTATATDADSDPLTYAMTGTPSGATFNTSTGAFSWTPTEAQGPGTYPVTVTVSDGTATDSESFDIVVNEVNLAPTLSSIGNQTIAENALLSFQIIGNDTDTPSNILTYSILNGPVGSSFNTLTGLFSWTPIYNDAGSYGPVTFGVSDGSLSATEDITITVTNVNRPPVLNAVSNVNVNENDPVAFSVSGTDPDGDAVTYSVSGLPSGATFDTNTGAFSWTPDFSQAGNHNVTFTISDGSLTDSESMTISVGNVNRAPSLASIGNQIVTELVALSLTASATDPDSDPITYSLTGAPAGMSIDSNSGALSWTPSETDGPNTYTFDVSASDGSLSDTETITVTVNEANVAPSAADDAVSTNEDTDAVINVSTLLVNDTDSDVPANTLSVSAVGNPVNGTVVLSGSTVTFSPTPNYVGPASFEYTLFDGTDSDTGLVNVSVDPVNDIPVITLTGAATLNLTVGDTYSELGATADDVEDGNGLTVTNIDSSAVDTNTIGSYSVTYDFTDSNGGVAVQVVRTVNVSLAPDTTPPVITLLGSATVTLTVGDTYTDAGATANDNVDGDITSQIVTNNPVNTAVAGTYTVTYDVTDAAGNAATQVTRTVVVNSVVVPPTPTIAACQDGIDNDNDGMTDWPIDPGCFDANDTDETDPVVTPPGGGGGGGNGPIGALGGGGGGAVLGASTGPVGQVLGVSIEMCSQYLTAYIHPTRANDSEQVSRLQRFLRDIEGFSNVSETGTYDSVSIDAVNQFQIRYAGDILSPWGASRPTSYVYYTTQKKINEAVCKFARQFPLSEQQLAEIERVRTQGVTVPASSGTVPSVTPSAPNTPAPETTPEVGATESVETTATVVEADTAPQPGFFKKLWNKLFGN